MRDWTYATKDDVEIRVDFSRPESNIQYRLDDGEWVPSPYQSAELNHLSADQVAAEVYQWLEGQY